MTTLEEYIIAYHKEDNKVWTTADEGNDSRSIGII
jgi:hypothetical protein